MNRQSSPHRLLTLLTGLLTLSLLPAQGEHPFLWQIKSYKGEALDKPCFVIGTMHLGDKRLVKLHPAVEKVIDNCDAFYAELDLVEAASAAPKMARMMMLPRGETLKSKLPADLYAELATELRHMGMGMSNLQRFRPWALTVTLAQMEAQRLGMTSSLDSTLFGFAREDEKETGGLEQVAEQLGALSAASEADQITLLRSNVEQIRKMREKGTTSMQQMLECYLSGDLDRLMLFMEEHQGEADGASYRMMQEMLDHRNRRMADRMHKRLQEDPKRYFFAVGVAHMPGPMGMHRMLSDLGYELERVTPTKTDLALLRRRVQLLQERTTQMRERAGLEAEEPTKGLESEAELRSEIDRLLRGTLRLGKKLFGAQEQKKEAVKAGK